MRIGDPFTVVMIVFAMVLIFPNSPIVRMRYSWCPALTWPLDTFMLEDMSAPITASGPILYWSKRVLFKKTLISRSGPPNTAIEATPSRRSTRGTIASSKYFCNSKVLFMPDTPYSSTGICDMSNFITIGSFMPDGR